MKKDTPSTVTGEPVPTEPTSTEPTSTEIVDTAPLCTFEALCITCNVPSEWVVELVEHGVIEPVDRSSLEWQFTGLSVVQVWKAQRLQRDLGLNPSGVALVFDLLAQIEKLQAQLRVSKFEPHETPT
jgi:chaperone modulatory protein CbpM